MEFGYTVAVSGDTVVVGAYMEDGWNGTDETAGGSGAAYVYTPAQGGWGLEAVLRAPNFQSNDRFGVVAIDDGTIVVGATLEDSAATGVNGNQLDNSAIDSGAAYVFTRTGTAWTYQAYLKASNTAAGDAFGTTVSVSGNTAVIGAPFRDWIVPGVATASDVGGAYVFVRDGDGNWSEQAFLEPLDRDPFDRFGYAVSVAGERLAVGAFERNTLPGAAYVFDRAGGAWSETARLGASNADANDLFGVSVALSSRTLVVGASGEDGDGGGGPANNGVSGDGAAYVFALPGSATTDTTPPVVTAPPDVLGVEATGSLTDVALGNATVTDDSGEELFAMPDPNGPFPLGETEVIWRATDSAGNTGTDTQLVSVVDTTPPVVTAPADITATAGTSIVLGEPTVEDAVGIDEASVSNDWPGGDFPAGTTTVTWTASDTSGNVGTDTQFVTITAALVPLDLDIAGFTATKRVRIGRSQSVDFTLRIRNASGNDVDFGRATLVGRLGATEVYRVTVMGVADPPGGGWTAVDLPPFTPDASMAGGTIIWEVTIQDGDPDDDVATATTTVVP